MTEREMARIVGFKYYNYVSTVKNSILEKKGYLAGPYYYVDFRRISKNVAKRLIVFTMFEKTYSYDFIVRLLKNIESWSFFYPLQESTFNEMMIGIYSTDNKKVIRVFEFLKERGVLHYYSIYELEGNFQTHNPLFFDGTAETDYLPEKIGFKEEYAEGPFERHDEGPMKLSTLDTRLLMYLQSGFMKSELSKIMKHNAKIVDEEGDHPYVWGYNAWRYSYEKLLKKRIIEKFYLVYPMPKHLCSYFFTIIKGKDHESTMKLSANIGSNARILRSGGIVKSLNPEDEGTYYWCAHIRSHPLFMHRISTMLELPEVDSKLIYYCRSVSNHDNIRYHVPYMNYYLEQSISLEKKYYDNSNMTIHYDYDAYLEEIREILEE